MLPSAVWLPSGSLPQRDELRSPLEPPSAALSADGRFLAFTSRARLTSDDANDVRDVYVLDRATARVTLETPMTFAGGARGDCDHPRISASGRYVAFEVVIGILEAGTIVRSRTDVAVRDRSLRTTKVLSASVHGGPSNGWSRGPAVSEDGQFVAFASAATDLVAGEDVNGSAEDVYIAAVATGVVRRISIGADGSQPATGASFSPAASADGRFVAFTSTADLLARSAGPPAANVARRGQVYLRDTARDQTILVSAVGEAAGNGTSSHPSISGDGRFVAFASDATDLVPNDKNRATDVFVWDARSAAPALVSRSHKGAAANGASTNPAISRDGRVVVFQSLASDIICSRRCTAATEDINLLWDVFLVERDGQRGLRVSGDADAGWMAASSGPAIDASGRTVAFSSTHPIDENDERADHDLFVRVLSDRYVLR